VKTILYVNHSSRISGAEQSLLELVTHLNRERFRPVVALPEDGPMGERLRGLGIAHCFVHLLRMRRTRNPARLLRYAMSVRRGVGELRRLVEREGVDLIHSNSTTAHLYGCWAAGRAGIPSVWQVRDMVPLGRVGRMLAGNSSRIIAVSQAVRRKMQPACGMDDRWCVVYNGVDIARFDETGGQAFRDEIGATDDDPVIGMIAQFVPWKRHRDFLMAATIVHHRLHNAKFVFVGEDLFNDHPAYKEELWELSESLQMRGSVVFAGYRDPIAPVIAGMDVVVLPSLGEPFGRALIEAGAAGLPVVAADDAGPREIVRDSETGFLVPPGDVNELAAAIERLARSPELALRMGEAARAHVAANFSSDRTARSIEAIYDGLLAPESGGRS